MAYVGIKGGEKAIAEAERLLHALRVAGAEQGETPLSLAAVEHQLHFLHGTILSEGGLYDPELAALAIKQSVGDPLEAAFFLRAYRCTRPRTGDTTPHGTETMRLIRRISSAFKQIPGGQILGPTPDFTQRLYNLELIDETPEQFRALFRDIFDHLGDDDTPDSFPKVLDALRQQGLVAPIRPSTTPAFDITREPIVFPIPRSAALATMSRGQQGSVLAMAYSNMRGYGDIHPTVAELRVGYLPVMMDHPATGEPVEVGEVLMTECEVIAMYDQADDGQVPAFSVGYGACFGHNETKAVSMAILDRALQKGMRDGPSNPSEDPEFVLLHIDGVDAMGFCIHYKMPHYVTFQSDLDRLRETQRKHHLEVDPDAESSSAPVENTQEVPSS